MCVKLFIGKTTLLGTNCFYRGVLKLTNLCPPKMIQAHPHDFTLKCFFVSHTCEYHGHPKY